MRMEKFLSIWSSNLDPRNLAVSLDNLGVGILLLVLFALPSVFVLYSKKSEGKTQLFWFVLTLLLSWPAYLVYLLVTASKKPRDTDLQLTPPGKSADSGLESNIR
jgi:hypothetical protein